MIFINVARYEEWARLNAYPEIENRKRQKGRSMRLTLIRNVRAREGEEPEPEYSIRR